MPAKRKKPGEKFKIYEMVKKLILDRVRYYFPSNFKQGARYRVAYRRGSVSDQWYLLEDEEDKSLILIKGEAIQVDGYIDGLNVYPRYSPLTSMMVDLGIITQDDADVFKSESRRVEDEEREKSSLSIAEETARRLGYKLVPVDK